MRFFFAIHPFAISEFYLGLSGFLYFFNGTLLIFLVSYRRSRSYSGPCLGHTTQWSYSVSGQRKALKKYNFRAPKFAYVKYFLYLCIVKRNNLYSIIYYVYNTQAFKDQKLVRDKCEISPS